MRPEAMHVAPRQPSRRALVSASLCLAVTLAAPRIRANTMSTLLDSQIAQPHWTPPASIPSVDVLDLLMQPVRSEVQVKAQVETTSKIKETTEIMALSARMMRAGDESYAIFIEQQPSLKRRLHWLAWTLEPLTDGALAYLVSRLAPAERRALLGALTEAGVTGAAAAVAAMLALLPGKPAQHSDMSADLRNRIEALTMSNGGRPRLRQEIDAYLESDPAAKAVIDRTRQALDAQTRVYFLFRSMIDHFGDARDAKGQLSKLNALPVPCRVVWLVHVYRSELHNGGIEQNFSNSGGALAPETAAALRLVQLDAHAAVMERGIALFPKPFPRDRSAPEWPSDISDKLYGLGDGLKAEEVDPALAAYALRAGILPK
jgi:hypothetical protein